MKNSTENNISRTNICEVNNFRKIKRVMGLIIPLRNHVNVLTDLFELLECGVCFGVVVVFLVLLFCFTFVTLGIELKILLIPGKCFINRTVFTMAS